MAQTQPQAVLCVDLDGTLIATDLLWEGVFELLRRQPVALLRMPLWLLRGRAHFKDQVARRVDVDAATLPYRPPVLAYVRQQKAAGRRVVLATGSPAHWADAVAEHLGLFDAVVASDVHCNCTGPRKLERIREGLAALGAGTFDYIGDSSADLPVWEAAQGRGFARRCAWVRRRMKWGGGDQPVFDLPSPANGGALRSLLRATRPYQWSKNLLLLVPLILSHQLTAWGKLAGAGLGVAAFCLCASAVYILNDLLDLRADRRHSRKRHRGFASGRASIPWGLAAAFCMTGASFALAGTLLPTAFVLLLAAYAALTTAYSLGLKRLAVLDVLTLAGLYTLRLLAGGRASEVWVSPWLIAFSLCIFMSLALAKRYAELLVVLDNQGQEARGRGYGVRDIRPVRTLGPAVGFAAAVVMALYMNSHMVREMYATPAWLWPVGPLVLLWIARVWWMARRRRLEEDPVLFALKDWWSYAMGAGIALCGLLAAMR